MMTLVTGLPGRGKTLYAVLLVREAVTAGRKVYSDIEGLKIPHEVIPPPEEPWDWRDTPPGSLIVYDEVHRRFPASGRGGESRIEQVNRLDTHRHSGHDFVFVTQYPGKIDKVIRDLVDRHVHLVRAFGLQGSLLHEWGFCQPSPESPTARREADKVRFKFPKDLYKSYASATTHSRYNAIQLSGRAWLFPVLAIALVFLLWRVVGSFSDRTAGPSATPEDIAVGTLQLQSSYAPQSQTSPPAPVGASGDIRGCITRGQSCRCFTDLQLVAAVDPWDCIIWSADPWAIQPLPYAYQPPPMYVPPLASTSGTVEQGTSTPTPTASGGLFGSPSL